MTPNLRTIDPGSVEPATRGTRGERSFLACLVVRSHRGAPRGRGPGQRFESCRAHARETQPECYEALLRRHYPRGKAPQRARTQDEIGARLLNWLYQKCHLTRHKTSVCIHKDQHFCLAGSALNSHSPPLPSPVSDMQQSGRYKLSPFLPLPSAPPTTELRSALSRLHTTT